MRKKAPAKKTAKKSPAKKSAAKKSLAGKGPAKQRTAAKRGAKARASRSSIPLELTNPTASAERILAHAHELARARSQAGLAALAHSQELHPSLLPAAVRTEHPRSSAVAVRSSGSIKPKG